MRLPQHLCILIAFLVSNAAFGLVSFEDLDVTDGAGLERQLARSSDEDRGRIQVVLGRYYVDQSVALADQQFLQAENNLAIDDLAGKALLARGQCLARMISGEMVQAMRLCEQSVALAERSEDSFVLANAYSEMTQIHYQSGNLEQAIMHTRLALDAAQDTKLPFLIATQHNNMGLMLQAQGDYKSSMDSFRTGLELISTVKSDPLYYPLTFNLGVSYANLDQHALALDFYRPVLEWTQQESLYRKELIAIVYMAISEIEVGRAVTAEVSLLAALDRPELSEYKGYLAYLHAALGYAQFKQKKHGEALTSYERGLEIAATDPNTFEQRRIDIGYAQVLAEVGRLDEAAQRLELVLAKLESEGSRHFQRSALEIMLQITRATGDVEGSLVVFEKLMEVQKQVKLYELEAELAIARAEFEVDSAERELVAAERDTIVRNGAIMLLLAVVVIGYLFVSRRIEVQRNLVQGQLAKRLEEEVDARTQELRQRMAETEAAESARREMEKQLSEADKLRVLGQLTGGVAHDFNNLLTVVIGAAELLKIGVDESKRADLLQHIMTAAESGADITRALMAYARKQPLQLESVELRAFLGERIPLLRRTMGGTVTLSLKFCVDGLCHVVIDPAQLTAALLNLALNARDAQSNQGDIEIALGTREDGFVEISVSDSGVGMTVQQLAHAVEPFYTTKTDNQGNGLGLSMVYGFSKQSGGDLEIESRAGQGTVVRLVLPVREPSSISVEPIDLEEHVSAAQGESQAVRSHETQLS